MVSKRFLRGFLALCVGAALPQAAFSQGERLWYKVYPNAPQTGFTKENQLVATDSGNNCYLVARTTRAARDADIQVMKLSPAGELLWERWIAGTARADDRALAIAVDAADNLVVAGYVDNEGTGRDALLAKFSPTGESVFSQQVTSPGVRSDEWSQLLVDRDDNLYVCGAHSTTSRADSTATLQVQAYSPSGATRWSQREESLNAIKARAVMALRPAYRLPLPPRASTALKPTMQAPSLVVARFHGDGQPGLRLMHYDLARGTVLATQEHRPTRFTDPGYSTPDRVADLGALSFLTKLQSLPNGMLTLMGDSEPRGRASGAFVIRFDLANNPLWATRFEAANGENCSATMFLLDAVGNVFLGGHNRTTGPRVDGIVAKISTTGRVLWQQSDRRIAWSKGIALDRTGRLIAIGRSEETGAARARASVLMFSRDGVGTLVETLDASDYRFEGTTSFNGHRTEPSALALSRDGSLYVGGEFAGPAFSGNLLIKYRLR